MKLLHLIEQGKYSRGKEPAEYNKFGCRLEGADIYRFDNGISLHTYTGDSWFLYIDGTLVSKPTELSDAKISAAFERARTKKLERII